MTLTFRVLIIMFLFYSTSIAQSFELFGGVALPQGDFADDKGEDAGIALTGFAGGITIISTFENPGLSWITSVALMYNGTDENVIKEELEQGLNINSGVKVDATSWMNLPILTGLRYATQIPDQINFYITGQIGMNFVMPPDVDISINAEDPFTNESLSLTSSQENESTNAFAYAVGGGLIINENIKVGIRYYGMGKPEIKSTVDVEATYTSSSTGSQTVSDSDAAEFKQEISILLITLDIAL